MKQTLSITVQGKSHRWSFLFKGNPEDIEAWVEDGLDVDQVLNSAPMWAVQLGLLRTWFRVQDVWKLLRLW